MSNWLSNYQEKNRQQALKVLEIAKKQELEKLKKRKNAKQNNIQSL